MSDPVEVLRYFQRMHGECCHCDGKPIGPVIEAVLSALEEARAEVTRLRGCPTDECENISRAERAEQEAERLRCIMRMLVNGIDNWNASVEKVIGRQPAYAWTALEEARAVLSPEAGE